MSVKLREKLKNVDLFTVSGEKGRLQPAEEAIARGRCVVLNDGVVEASGANAAKFVGITTEVGYANRDVLVAGGASTVLALSGGKIKEGDWLISNEKGKVVSAGPAIPGTPQYFVGYALKAAWVVDQLIPVVVWPMRVDNPAPQSTK